MFKAIRLARFFLGILIVVVAGIYGLVYITAHLILSEISFHSTYGKDWVQEYEKYHGSVAQTNVKIAAGIFGLIAMGVLLWWIYREVTADSRKRSPRRRR